MIGFLDRQCDDPFDPTPMLIHADWLEECGNIAGIEVFRGLSSAGHPSLIRLSSLVCGEIIAFHKDFLFDFDISENPEDGAIGYGFGDTFELNHEEPDSGGGEEPNEPYGVEFSEPNFPDLVSGEGEGSIEIGSATEYQDGDFDLCEGMG